MDVIDNQSIYVAVGLSKMTHLSGSYGGHHVVCKGFSPHVKMAFKP